MPTNIANQGFVQTFAAGFAALLTSAMELVFGPGVNARVVGLLTWADLGVFLVLTLLVVLVNGLAWSMLRQKMHKEEAHLEPKNWKAHIFASLDKPLYLLIWVFGIYLAATPLLLRFANGDSLGQLRQFVDKFFSIGVFIAVFWLFLRVTRIVESRLIAWSKKTESKLDDLVVPLLAKSLRVIVPVLAVIFTLPIIGLPSEYAAILSKGSSILIICAVAWILFQAVHLGEQALLAKYDIERAHVN